MDILGTSLKNKDTVCSTPRMTVNLVECTFKTFPASCTFEYPSNITIFDNCLVVSIYFICFKNGLQMNVPYFIVVS